MYHSVANKPYCKYELDFIDLNENEDISVDTFSMLTYRQK